MTDPSFPQSHPSATDADFQRLAALIGFVVPPAVARHYRQFNGGVPSLTAWDIGSGELLVISELLPMAPAVAGRRSMESTFELLQQRQAIKPGLVPFALDWGGNYISFNASGAVYFSAMDVWWPERSQQENIEHSTRYLAESFDAFITGLEADPDA